ncbi:MAG TPA: hypothetical protein PLI45_03465 [Candidatus Woesebacteria bacterium]|nr:hypothetical protein [Candidatus Woesebacteria bacterium]
MDNVPVVGDVVSFGPSPDKYVIVEKEDLQTDALDDIYVLKTQKLANDQFNPQSPIVDHYAFVPWTDFPPLSDEEAQKMTEEDLIDHQQWMEEEQKAISIRKGDMFSLEDLSFHGHMNRVFVW